jgi:hypothetical protein
MTTSSASKKLCHAELLLNPDKHPWRAVTAATCRLPRGRDRRPDRFRTIACGKIPFAALSTREVPKRLRGWPSEAGPRVRIRLPPAKSQQRTVSCREGESSGDRGGVFSARGNEAGAGLSRARSSPSNGGVPIRSTRVCTITRGVTRAPGSRLGSPASIVRSGSPARWSSKGACTAGASSG